MICSFVRGRRSRVRISKYSNGVTQLRQFIQELESPLNTKLYVSFLLLNQGIGADLSFFFKKKKEQLRFVETDRIVAFSKTHMFIFSIPAFQTIQVANDDINNNPLLDLIPPLWKLPCDGTRLCRGGISPLYYDGPPPAPILPTPRKNPIQRKNAPYIRSKIQPPEPPKPIVNPGMTNFTISCQKGIYAISIPSLKELKPRLSHILPYTSATQESGFSLGLSKAFFRHRDSSCTTLCYAWLEGEVSRNKGRTFRLRGGGLQVVRERGYPGRWDADPPVLDEGSGRVVMFTKEGLGVVDTALV